MFKKLRTIIYQVNDLDKAKEWYKKITDIAPYFDEPFYVGGISVAVAKDPFGNHIGLMEEKTTIK